MYGIIVYHNSSAECSQDLCERLQEASARNISFYSFLVSSLWQSVKLMDLVEIVGAVEHISSHF